MVHGTQPHREMGWPVKAKVSSPAAHTTKVATLARQGPMVATAPHIQMRMKTARLSFLPMRTKVAAIRSAIQRPA